MERLERGWLRKQPSREGVLNQETYWVTNRNPRRSRRGGCQLYATSFKCLQPSLSSNRMLQLAPHLLGVKEILGDQKEMERIGMVSLDIPSVSARYGFNQTVNKGSATLHLIDRLSPMFESGNNVSLYTSGDSVADLPLLFFNLQADAFRPLRERNPEKIKQRFIEQGVKDESFNTIMSGWKAGIVPYQSSQYLIQTIGRIHSSQPEKLLYQNCRKTPYF